MTPITPEEHRLLDAIAGSESPGYDVMYGGSRFTSFDDHPRRYHPIATGPNAGRKSSAAGRSQFLASTWDSVAPAAGLKDFSPRSQDLAAIWLARDVYRRRTGRSLTEDLMDATPENLLSIASTLSGTWTSLPGGIEPNDATNGFLARMMSDPSRAPRTASWTDGMAASEAARSMTQEIAPEASPAPPERPRRPSFTPTAYVPLAPAGRSAWWSA